MEKKFVEAMNKLFGADKVKLEEPLAQYTTFKIGGPADMLVKPENATELAAAVKLCREEEQPFYIIGNGSNLLVGDYGYRGVIIFIGRQMSDVFLEEKDGENLLYAQAGIPLSKLAVFAGKNSLKGLEFASGIPGTLGGAVTMNAGAYGGEMKQVLLYADIIDETGEKRTIPAEKMELGYRTSLIQKKGYIVIGAGLSLEKGNKEDIFRKMKEQNRMRKEKQPLELPSAGSTFKRPEGYFAGKLIMDAGLRGFRIGDMMVSEKHCGFVVNAGKGTAKDARKLISEVDRIVFEKFHVHLEPEVRFIGEF